MLPKDCFVYKSDDEKWISALVGILEEYRTPVVSWDQISTPKTVQANQLALFLDVNCKPLQVTRRFRDAERESFVRGKRVARTPIVVVVDCDKVVLRDNLGEVDDVVIWSDLKQSLETLCRVGLI